MAKEKSAGAVLFRLEKDGEGRGKEKVFYLVLHYHFKGDYWDFARGKIEKGETELQTARREIKEETGLEVQFVNGFEERTSWFYRLEGKNVFKQTVYFLAEAGDRKVQISSEHLGFDWLEYHEAMERLTYKNTKAILTSAHEFLKKRGVQDTLHAAADKGK
jgi:bis(5'-nucleosidyl)-tetraphosphatase